MNRIFFYCLIIVWTIFIITAFLSPQFAFSAFSSPDAIAIRVVSNPNHLDPLRWYKQEGFSGSPQSLTVDGYEAVRDGRTAYVNAANIIGDNFYTNIYIISYNQAAENQTVDIFGQILSRWKFNTNIPAERKDKVRHDTKRLSDLAEIKSALANYLDRKNSNGDFPSLSAGSYVAGKSISVWPSWQATLGKELGITLPLDPINKMGSCPGYNAKTCWDQKNQRFAGVPDGSSVYIYTYNGKKSYNICALMQSGYLTDLSQGACPGSALGHEVKCNDTTWTPRLNPDKVCSTQTITEISNCGNTRNILYGAKTDGVCCIPTNPGCAAETCVGQTCYNGCANVGGTKTDGICCVPTNPGCAAETCVGQTCHNGCANVGGTKTDGVCAAFTFSGNVKEALTGHNIGQVLVSAQTQAGVEIKSAATDGNGNFSIPLLTQNSDYKIVVTKSGYKDGGISHYAFTSDKTAQLYLLPDSFTGLAAIVLRWSGVSDLDSHLTFSAGGVAYHLYYSSKTVGGSVLDLDNTSSNGQETVTIRSAEAGEEYSYYVNSFRNGGFNDAVKVQLFDEFGILIREFSAQSRSERNWRVFKFVPSVGASSLIVQDTYN